MTTPLSSCCRKEAKASTFSEEGTGFYYCSMCDKACDILPGTDPEPAGEFMKWSQEAGIAFKKELKCDHIWMVTKWSGDCNYTSEDYPYLDYLTATKFTCSKCLQERGV